MNLPSLCTGLAGFCLSLAAPCHAAATDPVGYVSHSYGSGYTLIGAGLFQSDPDYSQGVVVSGVMNTPTVPVGATLQTYLTGDYTTYLRTEDGWENESGAAVLPFTLPAQFGAILFLPSPVNFVFSGGVAWVEGIDGPGPITAVPVAAPYAPTIHLLQNVNPVAPSYFADIIGRGPAEGDAVLQLDSSGTALISTFSGGVWNDPNGGNQAPEIGMGYSAFFDLSGNGFDGFSLPNGSMVPEPASGLLALVGVALAFRRRRD